MRLILENRELIKKIDDFIEYESKINDEIVLELQKHFYLYPEVESFQLEGFDLNRGDLHEEISRNSFEKKKKLLYRLEKIKPEFMFKMGKFYDNSVENVFNFIKRFDIKLFDKFDMYYVFYKKVGSDNFVKLLNDYDFQKYIFDNELENLDNIMKVYKNSKFLKIHNDFYDLEIGNDLGTI